MCEPTVMGKTVYKLNFQAKAAADLVLSVTLTRFNRKEDLIINKFKTAHTLENSHWALYSRFQTGQDFTCSLNTHTHNPVGGFLHWHVHNSNKSSALFRREVEQPGEADQRQEVPYSLRRSRDHVYSIPTRSPALITTYSPDIFVGVFYVCVCCALDASSAPPFARGETNRGSPAVLSHRILLNFYGLYTERPVGESLLKLTLTFVLTNALLSETKYGGTAEFSACLKAAH